MGRVKISISESDFDFQIFISSRITQCRIGLYNIMLIIALIYYILCLTLCIYDIYNTLYIISHNHFTFFLINIVTLYTFFQRVYATFCIFFQAVLCRMAYKARYVHDTPSDIRCTESHFVAPASYTLSHFVAFTFHTPFNITL